MAWRDLGEPWKPRRGGDIEVGRELAHLADELPSDDPPGAGPKRARKARTLRADPPETSVGFEPGDSLAHLTDAELVRLYLVVRVRRTATTDRVLREMEGRAERNGSVSDRETDVTFRWDEGSGSVVCRARDRHNVEAFDAAYRANLKTRKAGRAAR